MTDERKIGPNMQRLIAAFIARLSVPPGGGFADAIGVFLEKGRLQEVTREALKQTDLAITAMRAATDKFYADDEEIIAGIIMAEIDKARKDKFDE